MACVEIICNGHNLSLNFLQYKHFKFVVWFEEAIVWRSLAGYSHLPDQTGKISPATHWCVTKLVKPKNEKNLPTST